MLSITKRFTFEAAHHLPGHQGKCINLHGHSYKLEVTLSGSLSRIPPRNLAESMLIDFSKLKTVVKEEVIDTLDHFLLNDMLTLPTAEVLIEWIWDKLYTIFDGSEAVNWCRLSKLQLWETEDSWVTRT